MTHDLRSKINDEGYRPTEVIVLLPLLKRPKLEIFDSVVFTQIRPVRVGDLGTRQNNSKYR